MRPIVGRAFLRRVGGPRAARSESAWEFTREAVVRRARADATPVRYVRGSSGLILGSVGIVARAQVPYVPTRSMSPSACCDGEVSHRTT